MPLYKTRLGLLFLMPFIWPDAILAQLTLQKAVELGTKRQSVDPGCPSATNFEDSLEVRRSWLMEPSDNSFSLGPFNGLQWHFCPDRTSSFPCAATNVEDPPRQRPCVESSIRRTGRGNPCGDAALNTAVTYVELTAANAQLEAVKWQETAATRLLEIESKRVVERVDDPVRLLRAKLLAAKTRLRAAELQTSAVSLRSELAALTGATVDQLGPVVDSIPVIESAATENGADINSSLREALAARDVAQLDYVLAHRDRMGTNAKIVAGTSNLGDLVASYINEQEKFSILLAVNSEVQRAELWRLYLSGALEKWVLGKEQGLVQRDNSSHAFGTKPVIVTTEKPKGARTVRALMITPATGTLTRGASQQFSAIAIYDDGTAKDETSHAIWLCLSNSAAIVSTSGLVTALSTAQVNVTVRIADASQSRQITINAEDPALLNP